MKSVSKISLSNYFSAMKKYGRNLFITHLPRKMKWDSYFLSVFCSAAIIISLERSSFIRQKVLKKFFARLPINFHFQHFLLA